MLIHLEKLGKTFGEKVVLHDVTASVEREDRIGIVGQNGAGKTTLLKILTGEYQDYEGEFSVTHGVTLGYLEQNAKLDATLDIYGEMRATFAPVLDAMAQMQILERRMAAQPDNADLLAQHDALQNIVDAADGYNMDVNIKKVLSGMGFAQDTWQKNIAVLSGGELTRLRLAKLLLEKPDVLILDEPTNHLDFATMEWLENYLKGYSGAVLVVSHDRYFLDRVATRILELDKGRSYTYTGNYSAFLEQKAARIEREQASEAKRQNFLRNELKWLRRGAQARSTKQKARIARYEAVKNETPDLDRAAVEIGLKGSRLGRTVIELDHVSYEADGRTIVRDFSYTVLRHDRAAILGRNGTGKTTLLDLIAGRRTPTRGTVTIGQTVKIGYFTQRAAEMDERLRAIEYIEEAAHAITLADGSRISASQLMERFLFPSDLQSVPIGRLSGGERRRLYLLSILMEAPNVLLLDEPTNDLDVMTLSILEDYLQGFPGPILIVSHDRFLLDKLAEQVFEVRDGEVLRYSGNWSDWKAKRKEEEAPAKAEKPKAAQERPRERKLKFSFKEQREFETIDEDLAALEQQIRECEEAQGACGSDYVRLQELQAKQAELEAALEEKTERWMYLTELKEKIDAQ